MSQLSGARQLQVGINHRLMLADQGDFMQRIITAPRHARPDQESAAPLPEASVPVSTVVCDADELPFPGDSMDLVVLHHSADFSPFPHQVLREANRVLRSCGQLVILGFNPISLWGARKAVLRARHGPWGGRFLRRSRMEDWLRLLDFRLENTGSYFFRWPVQRQVLSQRRPAVERLEGQVLLPVGAYYCILASKQVGAHIRPTPDWRSRVITLPGAGTRGVSRGAAVRRSGVLRPGRWDDRRSQG